MKRQSKLEKYARMTTSEALNKLRTSALGLSRVEAENRLTRFGKNIIVQDRVFWRNFLLEQFKSPVFMLIFGMGFIYGVIGDPTDALIVFSFLLINLGISFLHEWRLRGAERKLRMLMPGKSKVIRGGSISILDNSELVPGDIVKLKLGDIVPADLRILEERGLATDDSIITGEAGHSIKNALPFSEENQNQIKMPNILLMNTAIVSGSAEAVVIATGEETYMGQLSLNVKKKFGLSLYEMEVVGFSKIIFKIVALIVALTILLKLIFSGTQDFFDFFIFYLALTVSILPEALSLVTAFALSRGSVKLAKKFVVVKRLNAIEDLGNIEILCTDKTGVLTENKLILEKIFSQQTKKCLKLAIAGSSFPKDGSFETSFDEALFNESSVQIRNEVKKIRWLDAIPFDHNRMKASVLIQKLGGEKMMIMRGAPEIVIRSCAWDGCTTKGLKKITGRTKILKEFEQESRKGNRVLAVAFKKIPPKQSQIAEKDEKNLTFVGFLSFVDPLKKTAKKTVSMAESLGVEIKILTGDSVATASEVAKEVGLTEGEKSKVISRGELENLSEKLFKKACFEKSIFARLSPELKIRIIETLRAQKRVGFLGEGANDCLALEKANIGLAVAGATDVSRSVADVLLLRKDLRVIVEGIKEGRKIFVNLNKYTRAALSANFGNFSSVALASLFFYQAPILPIQILLINLISDMALVSLATDKTEKSDLKKPAYFDVSRSVNLILIMTAINFIFGFFIIWFFSGEESPKIQTVWFAFSILSQIVLIFVLRARSFFEAETPGRILAISSMTAIFLAVSLPFSALGREVFNLYPLKISETVLVILIVFIYFIASELGKLLYRQSKNRL